MKKSLFLKMSTLLLVAVMLILCLPVATFAESAKVTPSKEAYAAKVNGGAAFICNATPISAKVGSKMYMTYTVGEVTTVPVQQGLGGCKDAYQAYPYYDGGLLYWGGTETMVKAGYTYFVEFTVTEKGFDYLAACGKGEELDYIAVNNKAGEGTAEMKHLGLWIDGSAVTTITNIHFYLADGTDLGVKTKGGAMREYTTPFPKATDVPHSYEFSVDGDVTIKFGNKLKNTTDKMYIEYTVVSDESAFRQTGFLINGKSIEDYSVYKYDGKAVAYKSELLMVGASYLIEFSNSYSNAAGWEMLIQRTSADGKTDWFRFDRQLGTASIENKGFTCMTFTDGGTAKFELKDFKIYDANHKSLGVKTTGAAIKKAVHTGQLESYADCDITYYNKKLNTYIAIYNDNSVKKTVSGKTAEGEYYVEDGEKAQLVAKFGSEDEKYTFSRAHLIDQEGNKYVALGQYNVNFVTGTKEKIDSQYLTNKTGYVAKKPEDPKSDNDKFVCWITRDGKEYNFDSIVNESITLYAKWEKDSGKTYTAIDVKVEKEKTDFTPYIAIGAAALIVLVTAAGFVVMIRRFKRK